MATYWHKHSRGFANECALLRAAHRGEALRLSNEGFTRLTRADVRRHIRWMNAENAAWGSGRAISDYSFDAVINPNHPDHAYKHSAATWFAERGSDD